MIKEILQKFIQYSDRIAIIDNDISYTYADLIREIDLSFEQVKVIPKGDTTILFADYTFKSTSLLFALALNENIIVPVTDTSKGELVSIKSITAATWEITVTNNEFEIINNKQPIDTSPLIVKLKELHHPGIILFSSGITGQPKAMIHDLKNLLESFTNKKSKRLNFMALLLFDHIGGLNTLFTCLFSGATITFINSRDPDYICSKCEKHNVHILPASPTLLNLILISGAYLNYDLKSLKIITYGTEPMPQGLLLKLNTAFPQVRFMQTYGTSETGISKMSSKSSSSLKVKFDDPDTEYKIVDGELWIRSATTILGYLNASMDKFADGWYKTGDLVVQDEDGYLNITGRNNDLINVGGLKVLPQEIESVLMQLPFIENCLVYAESSLILGHIVVAEVKVSDHTSDPKELKQVIKLHCKNHLDSYKIPVKIKFVNGIIYNDRFKKIRNK